MNNYICRECNIEVTDEDLHFFDDVVRKLVDKQLCFSCDFWVEKINIKNRNDVIRINQQHYIIGSETAETIGSFRGFNGRKFKIRFLDGREIITTNLWSQSRIPDLFKERLPDNAIFVEN